jgi:hypothetical protein
MTMEQSHAIDREIETDCENSYWEQTDRQNRDWEMTMEFEYEIDDYGT